MLGLQRTAGNRAVADLVADPARAHLARALLLRDGPTDAPPAPGQATNVPIGQPPPAQVTPADLAATTTPPPTVTYTGAGSAGGGGAAAPTPAPAPSAAQTPTTPGAGTAPTQAPGATPTPAPEGDTSHPHGDPMIQIDPFNVTVSYTVADLHLFRASSRLADVDILADPQGSVSVGLDPAHAVAGQASVNVILAHIKQNGDSVLDLGFGPTLTADSGGLHGGAQATAEAHITERVSITFTATVTPQANGAGGVDMNHSEVLGTAIHF